MALRLGDADGSDWKGFLTCIMTEVIVNSISRDLQLDQNPLAKALLGRAGGGLQVELTQKGQGQNLTDGCVLQTGGYGLGCSVVLHAILPYWNSKSEEQILRNIVAECLKTTEKQSLGSIAIPAIGTGNLGYPKKLVAKLMFDEVSKFSQKGNPKWLQEVHFVLHPSDTGTIKAFTDEITQSSLPKRMQISVSPFSFTAFVGKVSSESGVHTLQIGSVTLQVECGDITQEITDAIVNITNESFNLNTGVSKAILEGGGPAMAAECAQLASQPHNNLLCTTAGQLKCRNVLHLVAMADIKAQISKSLKECEQRQFTSVAFPAIGTGKAGRDPKMVANDMIDAIIDYARNTSAPVVKNIKIIIFQAHLLKVFHESMKRNEKANMRNLETSRGENLAMALPEEWEDMGQMRVKVVNLNPEVKEYVTVKQIFCQTCNSWTIEKIERIQNPFYWQAYQIKKQEMDAKNGHANNERNLFHGTASTSLTLINNSGFNRSYAGMHAAVYGNGTYFAVDASYSAHDTYSKPDANGRKYMYFARVLVGDYCVGAQGLIVPQPKNTTDPTNLYDSMTDNIQKPTLFVTFNDIQAYPEYLITFKK
uniref:Poly [ADP-ribose] polymerase n=1 Tax=Anolis carolinensis TaxID=28377 RepID=A0A803TY47_ANOCA